jgi:hypothetical protein
MLAPRRPLSPEVIAVREAAMASTRQLRKQVRDQARLIRSGALGELTEADVARLAAEMSAAARAQVDAAAPSGQGTAEDQELRATRREAAGILTAAARQAELTLREAWRRAGQEKAPGRWRFRR